VFIVEPLELLRPALRFVNFVERESVVRVQTIDVEVIEGQGRVFGPNSTNFGFVPVSIDKLVAGRGK
jgi:hypothetical protein